MQVKEVGESEGQLVMSWIGVEEVRLFVPIPHRVGIRADGRAIRLTLLHPKGGRLPTGHDLRYTYRTCFRRKSK